MHAEPIAVSQACASLFEGPVEALMRALIGIMALFTLLSVWSLRNALKKRRRAVLLRELAEHAGRLAHATVRENEHKPG